MFGGRLATGPNCFHCFVVTSGLAHCVKWLSPASSCNFFKPRELSWALFGHRWAEQSQEACAGIPGDLLSTAEEFHFRRDTVLTEGWWCLWGSNSPQIFLFYLLLHPTILALHMELGGFSGNICWILQDNVTMEWWLFVKDRFLLYLPLASSSVPLE